MSMPWPTFWRHENTRQLVSGSVGDRRKLSETIRTIGDRRTMSDPPQTPIHLHKNLRRTGKTGHESVFEPDNETVTGGTSRNDSCPGNWSQLQQRWSIRYLSIDLSQECCLIERAWSCVLGGRVECESVPEPNNKTETGGAGSSNDSCHDNWSHLR